MSNPDRARTARLLLVHALSPVHCGTGQAVGGIDLPIARERPTRIPLAPGSSIKGVLRAADAPGDMHTAVFGPENDNASEHAGGVQFSDANLVFLPVRSVAGTFAWVTSPYMLLRLLRDAAEAGVKLGSAPAAPSAHTRVFTTSKALHATEGKVVFEDLDFKADDSAELRRLAGAVAGHLFPAAEQAFFVDRACLVHDDVMSLLIDTGMEFIARNRIDDETGTVANGALWTEEALPVESVLAGLVVATPVKRPKKEKRDDQQALLDHVAALVDGRAIQIGGNATIGRGLCRMRMVS